MPTRQFALLVQLWRIVGAVITVVATVIAVAGCSLTSPDGDGESPITFSGPPAVRLVSPQPNATYLDGVAVNIQALVTNAGAEIDRVEVSVDSTIVATLSDSNPTNSPQFSIAHDLLTVEECVASAVTLRTCQPDDDAAWTIVDQMLEATGLTHAATIPPVR